MNNYQSNTYRKDLSWLHFDNEPLDIYCESKQKTLPRIKYKQNKVFQLTQIQFKASLFK